MKKISMMKAISLSQKYSKMNPDAKKELQKERLNEIVTYVKKNSPYYAEQYKEIADEFELTDLPPVNKVNLMAHFDEWPTDRNIKLEDLNHFMEDLDNIGRKYQGKYIIFTTSGSTGNPLVSICDKTTNNVMSAVNILRTYARKQDLKAFIKGGGKTIGIFANGGFYLGNSSVRARLLTMPWKKKQMAVTSALLPTEKIVKQLNEFQPTMLGGYPSNLELLVDEQLNGRLHINPVIIMTGGEYLSEEVRKKLSDTFHCYVQTSYSCTEGGTVACECTKHHFHINEDWLIVEAVDKDNKPVADGVQSDKILLTNLFNYSQPFIRYEVTDRIVMHHEKCECGNPSAWLTIEGRTDDVVSFTENESIIKIAPLAIYATLKEVHVLKRFQLIVHSGNQIELRLEASGETSREQAFAQAKETLKDFLATHGVSHYMVTLSDELPKQHAKSGKFKHIINETKPNCM